MGELEFAIAQAAIHENQQGQGRRSVVPAPVGGWNTQDPEAAMDQIYGVQMDNFFPERGKVRTRRGATQYADTNDAQPINSMFNWISGADDKLFAITRNNVYDVSNPAVTTAVSGITVTARPLAWRQHERAGDTRKRRRPTATN